MELIFPPQLNLRTTMKDILIFLQKYLKDSQKTWRNINIINKVVNLVKQKTNNDFCSSVAHSKLLSSALTLANNDNAHIDGTTNI